MLLVIVRPNTFSTLFKRKLQISRAWFSEQLRRWSNKPDDVGSMSVTTEFFLISCDSNHVPKWLGTHYNLEVPL